MDEREDIYDQIAREFGLTGNSPVASDRTTSGSISAFDYDPYTVLNLREPNANSNVYSVWQPYNDSYEDSVKQILTDICDILADLLYKEKLTGDHREDLASIRAFIDSIKVERESNEQI